MRAGSGSGKPRRSRVGGRLGERLDEQLDCAADLRPECFGDLLGRGDGFLEQDGEPLCRVTADDVLTADQGEEGVAGPGLLDPGKSIDDAGCGHRAFAGADQSPPAAVGDDAELDLVLAQERLGAVDGRCGPEVVRGLAQRIGRVDDVHERTDPVDTVQGRMGGDSDSAVGRLGLDAGRLAP